MSRRLPSAFGPERRISADVIILPIRMAAAYNSEMKRQLALGVDPPPRGPWLPIIVEGNAKNAGRRGRRRINQ